MTISVNRIQFLVTIDKSDNERIQKYISNKKYASRQHFTERAITKLLESEEFELGKINIPLPSDIKKEVALNDEADLHE